MKVPQLLTLKLRKVQEKDFKNGVVIKTEGCFFKVRWDVYGRRRFPFMINGPAQTVAHSLVKSPTNVTAN